VYIGYKKRHTVAPKKYVRRGEQKRFWRTGLKASFSWQFMLITRIEFSVSFPFANR
jgi:hypothetical protein